MDTIPDGVTQDQHEYALSFLEDIERDRIMREEIEDDLYFRELIAHYGAGALDELPVHIDEVPY